MKKRILLWLVVLLLGLLTACTGQTPSEPVANDIWGKAKALDEEGILHEIPNSDIAKIKSVKNIQFFQGNLLVETNKQLILISLETGETLCKATIEKDTSKILAQVCGDKIVVVESSQEMVFKVLNSQLQETSRHSLPKGGNVICLNQDATKVFCYESSYSLVLIDLVSGESEILMKGIQMQKNREKSVFTDYLNSKKYVLDLKNNTVKEIRSFGQKDIIRYDNHRWIAKDESFYQLYAGNETQSYFWKTLDVIGTPYLVDGVADIYISGVGDEGYEAGLYKLDGTFVSKQVFESSATLSLPLWSEDAGGYFMVKIGSTKSSLLFWNTQISMKGESVESDLEHIYEAETDEQGMQLCRNKVAELSQKYGVEIEIGEECETEYDEQRATLELRPERIYEGLCVLDKAFSLYPDGFVSQMAFGKYKTIKVSLVAALIPKKVAQMTAAALTTYKEGRTELVVGINNMGLEGNIYHEMMHVIDYRLDYDKYMGFSKVYDEEAWKALNPKGFQYFDEYKQALDEEDKEQAENYREWFVDEYGMTNTYEDRATIMKAATMGEVDVFKDSPHLIKKLDYLCKYIRQGLDTTGWPEKMPWEETLDKCRQ